MATAGREKSSITYSGTIRPIVVKSEIPMAADAEKSAPKKAIVKTKANIEEVYKKKKAKILPAILLGTGAPSIAIETTMRGWSTRVSSFESSLKSTITRMILIPPVREIIAPPMSEIIKRTKIEISLISASSGL